MNLNKRFVSFNQLPAPVLALLALLVGILLGLVIVLPEILGQGTALDQLTNLLLPASAMLALFVLSLFSPLAALLVWLLLAPYSIHLPLAISLGAGIPDVSLNRVMSGWLLLLILARAASGRYRLRPLTWSDLAYALFVLAMLLSINRSPFGTVFAFQSLLDGYVVPFVALFLARQIVRDLTDLRWYSVVLLVAGLGFSFLIIREQLTGQVLFSLRESAAYGRNLRRVVSLMGNAAPLGVSTAMTLPLGLVLMIQGFSTDQLAPPVRRLVQTLLVIGNAAIALGVFMTYNRASWLGIVFAILLLVILRPGARRVLTPILIAAVLLALIFWRAVVTSPAVTERLLEDQSLGYRTEAATIALDIVQEDPVFGAGYYSFGPIAKESYGWDPAPVFGSYPAAHNSYLFILVSAGLLALLPYLAWMGLVAVGGWRRYMELGTSEDGVSAEQARDALAAGAAILLTYAVASASFDNAQATMMNLIFMMTIGAIWGGTQTVDGRQGFGGKRQGVTGDR